MIKQVRFRWSNSDAVTDTWEDKLELHTRFPATTAWGQATTQEEGDVTTIDKATPPAPRPVRQGRPNTMTSGPECVNQVVTIT